MSNHSNNLWWGPPRNFSDRKNERKISWLELFYDLVYVAAIGQLTHHLAAHLSWHTLGFSFLLFCLVFWSWVNGSQYYDLHGNDSIRTRVFTFLQMLAVAAVAVTLPGTFEGHHQQFALAFAIVQIIITYLWWSIGLYDPSHRVFNIFYTVNYSLALALMIASVFVHGNIVMVLWIIALLLNLTPSLIGARTIVRVLKERGQVFTASAAIVERFGLFTIIVLAESILSTVGAIAEVKEVQPIAWFAFLLAFVISFLLWNLYFDMTSEQETKKGYSYMQWMIFLHYPLLASLSMVGACIRILLVHISSTGSMVQWVFCLSLSIIVFLVTAIAKIMEEEEEDRAYIIPVSRVLLVIGGCLLVVPLFGKYLGTLAFMSVVALLLFIPVLVGVRSWVKYKFF